MNNNGFFETNKLLKIKLKEIKDRIESEFIKNKRIKFDKEKKENYKYYEKKSEIFNNKIDEYKNKIEDLNLNLSNSKECIIAIKNENLLYCLKEQLVNLKKENETLNKINKKQENFINENNEKLNYSEEEKIKFERWKNLKDEIKILKDYNKNVEKEIKIQNKEILKIKDYCKLVNENIIYKKNNVDNLNDNNIEKEIELLSEQIKKNETLLKNQELTYKRNIKKQKLKINELNDEINILKIKINHTKKDETINLLKYKELQKLSNNNNLYHSERNKNLSSKYLNNSMIIKKRNKTPFEIGKFRNRSQEFLFNNKNNFNKIFKNRNILKQNILLNNIKENSYLNLNNNLFHNNLKL